MWRVAVNVTKNNLHKNFFKPASVLSPFDSQYSILSSLCVTGTRSELRYMSSQAKRPCTENMTLKKIGTHNGTFHCDEVLACFILRQLPEYKVSPGWVWWECPVNCDIHKFIHKEGSWFFSFHSTRAVPQVQLVLFFSLNIIYLTTQKRRVLYLWLLVKKKKKRIYLSDSWYVISQYSKWGCYCTEDRITRKIELSFTLHNSSLSNILFIWLNYLIK